MTDQRGRVAVSSAQTFAAKIISPALWVGGFGSGTMALFVIGDSLCDKSGASPPVEIKWIFLAVWIHDWHRLGADAAARDAGADTKDSR